MDTDALIEQLGARLKEEKKPLGRPLLRALWWITPFVLICAPVFLLGLRPDLLSGSPTSGLLIYVAGLMGAFLSLSYLTWKSGIPAGQPRPWARYLLGLSWITIVFGIAEMTRVDWTSGSLMEGLALHGRACSQAEVALAILPSLVFVVLYRRLAPTRPWRTGALGLAALGVLTTVTLGLHCPSNNPVHILVWHFLPVVFFTGVGAFLGRKLLSW